MVSVTNEFEGWTIEEHAARVLPRTARLGDTQDVRLKGVFGNTCTYRFEYVEEETEGRLGETIIVRGWRRGEHDPLVLATSV